ncbi:MAG: hypothetical protein RL377_537, partial [Bacteroidota bacterium]
PGTKNIAGSQDALGIVLPGLNKLNYDASYWPASIESVQEEAILSFLEQHLYLIPLDPRHKEYDVLSNTHITELGAKALADAANACWDAIMAMDLQGFGKAFTASFDAQIKMFPNMVDAYLMKTIEELSIHALGYKLSGAGGGGYLIMISEQAIANALQIKIRRKNSI